MRNIFDQYTQPENRLTHALVCTLEADRALLRPFLRWVGARDVPRLSDLKVTEQQVPGVIVSGDESEGRGLPDACVYSDDGWALLIESKVQSGTATNQLRRHVATAKRYGFERPYLLLISVDTAPGRMPERSSHRAWRELYEWFGRRAGSSPWARSFVTYLEAFEAKMVGQEYGIRGTLTMFDGLKFDDDNPYTYFEAKRRLRLLADALQERKDLHRLGVDPKGMRRSAITGRTGQRVWDFLPLRAARQANNFTDCPHLTVGVGADMASASITVPNGVKGGFRTKLRDASEDGFIDLLQGIERRLRPVIRRSKGSKPSVYALQRHYRSQRSEPAIDARLGADLRTLIPGKRSVAKYQPEWGWALYEVLTNKRSNIQFGLSVQFDYGCPVLRSAKAVELFADSWRAMSPLLSFVMDE